MRKFLSQLMVPLQFVLMLIGSVLTFVQRIPQLWMTHVYYGWVKLKRRVAGEPTWQEHDTLIGFYPPRDHPFWKRPPVMLAPEDLEDNFPGFLHGPRDNDEPPKAA